MTVLGGLVAAGALTVSVSALQQAPQQRVVEVQKVRDNLYVMTGGGGNSGVFIGTDGVTVVDTKNPGWGQPLLDKIKTVTDKPVIRIINTHTHGDHTSGNVEFPATVDVVTHANTKTYIEQNNPVFGLQTTANPSIFASNGNRNAPKRTFTDRMTIGSGADQIELHHVGPAHTGGDAFVIFTAARVMHTGDTFPTRDLPIMDKNNGGSAVRYAQTLNGAYEVATRARVDTIINGHNATTMTPADLKTYSEFVGDFVKFAQDAKRAGKTVDEVVATWKTPAKYTGYANPQPARIKADAEVAFGETN